MPEPERGPGAPARPEGGPVGAAGGAVFASAGDGAGAAVRCDGASDEPGAGCFTRYRRPAVRDLAWLVFDGALQLPPGSGTIAAVVLGAEERAELLELLSQWDADEQDDWLGPVAPGLRLGLYVERLIGAWLANSRRIRLLAQNWPLRSSRMTLGEADLLLQRQGGQGGRQLWELACKFYLGLPDDRWVGPGLNDTLATKLDRMRRHQLQLIHQPGFQVAWPGHWSALAWLTGWLLQPAAEATAARAGRIAAVWAEAGDASLASATASASALGIEQWWLLPKRRWLRPAHGDPAPAECYPSLQAAEAFIMGPVAPKQRGSDRARPLMLAGMRRMQTGEVAEEMLRLMLVPRGWSQLAAAMPLQSASSADRSSAP